MKRSERTIFVLALVVGVLLAGAVMPAAADKVTVINYYGPAPFVVGGYSYLPLRTATDFIGAALLWDSLKNRATITFSGRKIGLVIGSPYCWYGGRQVLLPAAPIIVRDQLFVPSAVFGEYLQVPVIYDPGLRVIRIQRGPRAWGTLKIGRVPSGYRFARGEHGAWGAWGGREHGKQWGPYWRGPGEAHGKGHGKARAEGRGKGHGKGQSKGHGKGHGGKD
jgi:hypothetical protein